MTFPDNVLSPEQIASRAAHVLVNLGEQIDLWGWECITPEGRKVAKWVWTRMTLELADARDRIEAAK